MEFPPPDELLKPNDGVKVLWVSATRWSCPRCDPKETWGAHTSVCWVGGFGRCSLCGQKLALGDPRDRHFPSVDEQLRRNL